ncbi:MAG: hypothetical protein PHW64_01395 [Sulfuricurvum sp.]|nr:hypothetical protein [Sulfuricurvum sp.]
MAKIPFGAAVIAITIFLSGCGHKAPPSYQNASVKAEFSVAV